MGTGFFMLRGKGLRDFLFSRNSGGQALYFKYIQFDGDYARG